MTRSCITPSNVVVLVAAVVLGVACGPPPGARSGASAGGGVARRGALAGAVLREDRVTITRGTVVRAVAAARRFLYAATTDAIIVYDRDRRTWLPPFTREGGFDPALVRRIAVDPDDDSAWLISTMGAWTLQPLTAFIARAPAGPLPSRLRVPSLDAVYREFPSVESFGRLLTRDDASLQSYPVLSGARAPDRSEVWLGTNGGGLVQVDPLFNHVESHPYGLASVGAGALARAADGVWIAPAARGVEPRLGITFASRDLQQWRWLDDATQRGVGGARATSLAVAGSTMWMGTTRGLFRIPLGSGARTFSPIGGLPGDVVVSLLARRDGVWVGTDAGLGFLASDSAERRGNATVVSDAPRAAVRALFATGDTVWIGTDAGLLLRPPGSDTRLVRPAAVDAQPRLRQPIRAIAGADSVVFVALADGVLAFSLQSGGWREPYPASPWRAVGAIDAFAADARTVWAGGPFGVIAVDRATGGSRSLRVGSDLPEGVTSIVLDGPIAWIGTLGGVVRVRRAGDGQLP